MSFEAHNQYFKMNDGNHSFDLVLPGKAKTIHIIIQYGANKIT